MCKATLTRWKFLICFWVFASFFENGAAQRPNDDERRSGIVHCQKTDSKEESPNRYTMSMNVEAVPGPQGLIQIPPGLSFDENLKEDRAKVSESFWFPSLYFFISASPYLTPLKKKGESHLFDVLGLDQDVKWFDVSITLEAQCKKGQSGDDCSLKVISLLPSRTASGNRDRLITRVAGAAESLGGIVAPFFPGSSFNEKLGASGGALRVLFQNLFPPEVVAHQYAFLSRASRTSASFGWFFKQRDTGESPSILGLHQGIALLQVGKGVDRIDVRYGLLSQWEQSTQRAANTFLDLQYCEAGAITRPRGKPEPDLDYGKLKSLEEFPMLIPREEAEKILHLKDGALLSYLQDAKISTVPANPQAGDEYWVVRRALQGLLEPPKVEETPEP